MGCPILYLGVQPDDACLSLDTLVDMRHEPPATREPVESKPSAAGEQGNFFRQLNTA